MEGPSQKDNWGPKQQGSAGPVIAIIIIVGMLVIGALYLWGEQTTKQEEIALEIQGVSDELQIIEPGLSAVPLSGPDVEHRNSKAELSP